MQKKKRGRPPLDNPATAKLPMIRVKPEQLLSYRTAAESSGDTLAAWVRSQLDKAAKKELKQ